jgi:hypothetical protein
MSERTITVKVEGNRHKCEPTVTHVKAGDTVEWVGEPIRFPDSPFVEGHGPFQHPRKSTIRPDAEVGKVFKGVVQVNGRDLPVEGQIIVDAR